MDLTKPFINIFLIYNFLFNVDSFNYYRDLKDSFIVCDISLSDSSSYYMIIWNERLEISPRVFNLKEQPITIINKGIVGSKNAVYPKTTSKRTKFGNSFLISYDIVVYKNSSINYLNTFLGMNIPNCKIPIREQFPNIWYDLHNGEFLSNKFKIMTINSSLVHEKFGETFDPYFL